MSAAISYADAPVPVRPDLVEAHRRAWLCLARPGTWWSGVERVAIAAEVRNAALCRDCEAAELAPPGAEATPHAAVTALRPAALEAVHSVARAPARLTRAWLERTLAAGLQDGEYVELLSVAVTVIAVDSFCRGLGAALHALPEPQPGEPTRYRPRAAVLEAAWVATIPASAIGGSEADLWPRGRTGNVVRAFSLVPDAVRQLSELVAAHYMPFARMLDLREARCIDRSQIELLAARVSALRGCFY